MGIPEHGYSLRSCACHGTHLSVLINRYSTPHLYLVHSLQTDLLRPDSSSRQLDAGRGKGASDSEGCIELPSGQESQLSILKSLAVLCILMSDIVTDEEAVSSAGLSNVTLVIDTCLLARVPHA